jgi:hypothetical protein
MECLISAMTHVPLLIHKHFGQPFGGVECLNVELGVLFEFDVLSNQHFECIIMVNCAGEPQKGGQHSRQFPQLYATTTPELLL